MNRVALFIPIIGGICVAFQAGVNGALGRKIGTVEGAFISFFVGAFTLLIAMLVIGKGDVMRVFTVPKWQLLGGVLGSIYVVCMVIATPRIGVASAIVALIFGQVVASMIIDHFGLISGQAIPISGKRILGVLLLGVAMYLFYNGD
ncbi:DMT family transporter [Hazenella sp. IB182357]|uniref:DMT family transporter n=1 Tax=Polycladospora coralii TaxID=2771432 RepID=A0A926RW96_9BACL|nr:DMT family transporter [Polycladospora coralii]MBD1371266.1 DMT family transporter [Polycladospora coralii]MBS7530221.1 DMT family transporter [Polycladospora coralii]